MNLSHYYSLFFGYGTALGFWFLLSRYISYLWNHKQTKFEKPAREFIYALLAGIAILGVGQLYMNGFLIPSPASLSSGEGFAILVESLNQLLIYSPMPLLLLIRRQGPETAWLPLTDIGLRLAIGIGTALAAIAVFVAVRSNSLPLPAVLYDTFNYRNLPHLVQVLLEDLTIAILFVRLRGWAGTMWSILIVAALFAGGHIPVMIAEGVNLAGFGSLILDTALAVGILSVLQKAKDIWWFWWVHFAMDMMQYYTVS